MKIFVALAVVCTVILTGCAREYRESYTVKLDGSLSTGQIDVAMSGLEAWTSATGVRFRTLFASDGCGDDSTICIKVVPEETVLEVAAKHGTLCPVNDFLDGTTDWNWNASSTIYMAGDEPRMDAEEWRVSLMHEIGHALGLVHASEGTLMYKYYVGDAHEITEDDVRQYEQLRLY